MIRFDVHVTAEGGLHARPAALLVNNAGQFQSKVTVIKDQKKADGKSILGIMTLGASQGDRLTLEIEGADEEQAAAVLKELFDKQFES
ncbi:HPr family phosphocarrier protein [Brevibacillus borstelensis]|uniref:HPr family phosphocarrier protein n=1 Tax=Brevibacillus borstelensis TaxID=45462 RepID=UPI002040F885|nr:HPr family phosphocarrier protein [Brevibacillus borstelensis]MCM3473301.1 HPr family phosphocarrier protein [Brevibacillus borstelensis]MCM3561429.1 HPr family phosphocarrier protein [Brevibacillus borstelensis]